MASRKRRASNSEPSPQTYEYESEYELDSENSSNGSDTLDWVESVSAVTDYRSWSLSDLRKELRSRKVSHSGKKEQLVQRLLGTDQFYNYVNLPKETSYKLPEPGPQYYFDINSDSHVPIINEDDLNHFAVLVEQEDVLEAENMYNDGYLLTCRLAYEPTGNAYYINALCTSENKNIPYKITMKFVDNMILEAQCECADTAPFAQCKHVIVAIYGIIDFTKTKTINACVSFPFTSQSYSGNPVKAEDLVLKANDAKLKSIAKFDPRPARRESPEDYVNNFKNLVANYCDAHNCTMPILQIMEKSEINTHQDHNYSQKTAKEEMIICEGTD